MKKMWNQTIQGKVAIGYLHQMIKQNYLNELDLFLSYKCKLSKDKLHGKLWGN